MGDARVLAYLNAVDVALKSETNEILTTTKCTECEGIVGQDFNSADHWVLFDAARGELVVVIGCEGYWQVDPSAVGIKSEHWMGIPGLNI